MAKHQSIVIVSDIHYAGPDERARGWKEDEIISQPALRLTVSAYRHFLWKRDPFAHNYLLDLFLDRIDGSLPVIANGDYSCDTDFVGVSDAAARQSAAMCLAKLRQRLGSNLQTVIGDHELGKMSLFGGRGGMRLASWHRTLDALQLIPFWKLELGRNVLIGVTSSLIALPVYEPETLPEERRDWQLLRAEHLELVRRAFDALKPKERVLLFCHDPTALPFLYREAAVRAKLGQIDKTVIGHLHSRWLWRISRMLSGMPVVPFLGNTMRRLSEALREGRSWSHFRILLCPALTGIELAKDGGFYHAELDWDAAKPARFFFQPIPWRNQL